MGCRRHDSCDNGNDDCGGSIVVVAVTTVMVVMVILILLFVKVVSMTRQIFVRGYLKKLEKQNLYKIGKLKK